MNLLVGAGVAVVLLWLLFRRKRPKNAENVSNGPPQALSPPALKDVTDYEWEELRAAEREAEILKIRRAYNKRLERAMKALSPPEGGAEGGDDDDMPQERAGH